MKFLYVLFLIASFALSAAAQSRTNDSIRSQIRSLGAQSSIELEFDPSSNTTKIKAVAENFSNSEAHSAGVKAMNFAAGFIFPGDELKPENASNFIFAFWVLSSKPRFGDDHSCKLELAGTTLDLGSARYVARQRDNMEYLNFNLTRDQLRSIAEVGDARLTLGGRQFTFTKGQLKLLADLYLITEVN